MHNFKIHEQKWNIIGTKWRNQAIIGNTRYNYRIKISVTSNRVNVNSNRINVTSLVGMAIMRSAN